MDSQLFIPEKIKVGYQKRDDTYTKRLAYVIYYDQKGVLRKETSWRGWIQKNLGIDDFDNKPHSGFVINKDIQRSSEWFGDGHNMIRVYDDRGIEFEITTGNLMFILMTTDCLKRGLQGEFVYSWWGKDLVLLPTGCDEYKDSLAFTSLQAGKVSAKSLIEGGSYKTKRQEDLIYLGKFDWHTFSHQSNTEKMYVFVNSQNELVPLKSLTSLASQTSDVPVTNYSDLMDKFNKSIYSTKVIGLDSKEVTDIEFKPRKRYEWDYVVEREDGFYLMNDDKSFTEYSLEKEREFNYGTSREKLTGFYLFTKTHNLSFNDKKGLSYEYVNYDDKTRQRKVTLEELKAMQFVTPNVVTESGKKFKINKFMKLNRGY